MFRYCLLVSTSQLWSTRRGTKTLPKIFTNECCARFSNFARQSSTTLVSGLNPLYALLQYKKIQHLEEHRSMLDLNISVMMLLNKANTCTLNIENARCWCSHHSGLRLVFPWVYALHGDYHKGPEDIVFDRSSESEVQLNDLLQVSCGIPNGWQVGRDVTR